MLVTLTIHLHLPGCGSLKEKRGRIKPFMAALRREHNLSVAELDYQDHWQQAVLGCVMIGNDQRYLAGAIQTVANWVDAHWTDGDVMEQHIDFMA